MPQLKVTIVDTITNTEKETELPDNVATKRLLPQLAKQWGVQQQAGGRYNYQLMNKTQGFNYTDEDTLESRGTKVGDVLGFTYEFEAG